MLYTVLRALGVPAERIPPTKEERAALYRSTLGQIPQPVLVIADNAATEAQVRPLLPGSGPHRVLATSRNTLAGLGARLLDVTILDPHDSADLLDKALHTARPHDTRISSDPAAAARIAAACGGLPLALQIAAATLIADPAQSAADLADDLSTEHQRLEHLRYDDGSGPTAPSVAAAFELSYQRLDPDSARMFRLSSVHPGPDISTDAAAIITGQPQASARQALAKLAKAHLIEAVPGAPGRWRMHDLLRLYARKLSDDYADADNRDCALDQILGHYLTLAQAADKQLSALHDEPRRSDFTGRLAALDWFDAHRAALTAAIHLAADTGRDQIALNLPFNLCEYLAWRRRFDELLTALAISLSTARALHDRHSEGKALNDIGVTLHEVRRFDEAITATQDAVRIYQETGDATARLRP